MSLVIFALFIVMPILEIALLIEFGSWLGTLPTIAVILVTAVLGTTMLQRQSLGVMARTQQALAEGRPPVDEVADGACLLVAGAFLLTPGLITDAMGFALFVPPVRRFLASRVFRYFMARGNVHVHTTNSRHPGPGKTGPGNTGRRGPVVIDGEFEPVSPSQGEWSAGPSSTSVPPTGPSDAQGDYPGNGTRDVAGDDVNGNGRKPSDSGARSDTPWAGPRS